MVTDTSCPFCVIGTQQGLRTRLVFRDDQVAAFFPLDPATRGHVLIAPLRHVTNISELSSDEMCSIAAAISRLDEAIQSGLHPDGLNVIQSNGAAATQTVSHLHVHMVPRWTGDKMVLKWPRDTNQAETDLDETLLALRSHLPNKISGLSPEDRRQHLAFIQEVIARMSQSSSAAKTWLLPIIVATFGYSIAREAPFVALFGLFAVLIFGLLDANYLKQERSFRNLYDDVAGGGKVPQFSMNPTLAASDNKKANYWPDSEDLRSWAIAPFYGPILLAGVGIFIYLLCQT